MIDFQRIEVLDVVVLDQDEAIWVKGEESFVFISNLRRQTFRRPSDLEQKRT